MLSTTYKQILEGSDETPESLLKFLESVTGSYVIYGLSKPIYLAEILDAAGLDVTLALYPLCPDATSPFTGTIALAWVESYLSVWNTYTGNQIQVPQILQLTNQYMTQEQGTELDMCGRPKPPSTVLSDRVEALIAELEVYLETWNYTKLAPKTYVWVGVGPTKKTEEDLINGLPQDWRFHWLTGEEDFKQDKASWGGNISSIDLPWHSEVKFDAAFESNPDYYLKESKHIIETSFTQETPYYYQRVELTPAGGYLDSSAWPDYQALAAKYVAQAAITAASITLWGLGSLATVALLLQQALSALHSQSYRDVSPQFLRLSELQKGIVMMPASEPGTPLYVTEKQIIDAMWNKRVELLRDRDYVESFDKDLSGGLNTQERLTMEADVKEQMMATAQALAVQAETSLTAQYAIPTTDTLATILRPYLML